VRLAPWQYLFAGFNSDHFPDIFRPVWVVSLVLLVALIILYNVRTRRLHRHAPYVEMYEWLLWTGVITFSLLLIGAVFVFDFFIVLLTAIIGIATFVWIRFRRFPPILAAYEARLARERYFTKQKFSDPDATIRRRGGRRPRRRR
jgi:ABC-type xylose transport system permease subunit